jgi:photosystem II stability/assembly factor-like uncharacterized protein
MPPLNIFYRKKFTVLILGLILFPILSCERNGSGHQPEGWKVTTFQTDFEYQRIAIAGQNTLYVYGIKLNHDHSGLLYTLIKSTDAGETWNKVEMDEVDIYQMGGWIEMGFFNDTDGIITGYRTLFKTMDGGIHWDITDLGYDDFSGLVIHENRIFGFYGGSFRYSDNKGLDWIEISEPEYVSSLCFVNTKEGYASASTGFYQTKDAGTSWQKRSSPGISFLKMDFYDCQHGIATSTYQDSPHAYPETHINLTEDGGYNWITLKLDSVSTASLEPETPVLYKSMNEIYVGCVNGIYLSRDQGVTWIQDYVDHLYNAGIWIRDLKLVDDKIIAVGWGGLILSK